MINQEVSLWYFCFYATKYNDCLEKITCVVELRIELDTFIREHHFYLKNNQPTNYEYLKVGIWRTKTILEKSEDFSNNNKVGGFTLLDFKTVPQFTVIKAVGFWQRQAYRAMPESWEAVVAWFWQGCPGGRWIFSINRAGRTEYPNTKEWIWNWVSYHTSKLAWNGSYA